VSILTKREIIGRLCGKLLRASKPEPR